MKREGIKKPEEISGPAKKYLESLEKKIELQKDVMKRGLRMRIESIKTGLELFQKRLSEIIRGL